MIYVDSCLIIYAVERDDALGERARAVLSSAELPLALSPLVMLESLVRPMRDGDAQAQLTMWSAFDAFELLPVEPDTFLDAAMLRARYRGLQTADAVHLAVARQTGCTALWTNDSRLEAAAPGLAIDVIGAPS
ncbi:type II toxin-antitoxin system VapC family toxin [Microbacterium enclense]|uniref:Ribonuclease VapC n=1 Tax=Microbacterium enclense TaxID=993073 RepID=A0A1G6GHB2_9MICO|nr:type II toxin-antitoxin system VapC family toxin [Microbacterium enclense]KSU56200.1 hypothetical protein AS029_00055 [Microbacterium enclense]SDB81391.1 Predicted nucleic acid-binding protein, contains PIN domain [Microbacterium enclense]